MVLLVCLLPVLGMLTAAFFMATAPHRRREQGRMFLDFLDLGLKDGRNLEEMIVSASRTRERSLGAHFHLLAAHLENGLRLQHALGVVPELLPPAVTGILCAGLESNSPRDAVAAAKRALGSRLENTQSLMHYAFVIVLLVAPFSLFFLPFWRAVIWNRTAQIAADMEAPLPAITVFLADHGGWIVLAYALFILVSCWLVFFYLAPGTGPVGPMRDRILSALPWIWRRQQRNFSLALALLLDAGYPEDKALRLAGEATGSSHVRRKLRRLRHDLEQGLTLPNVLTRFDRTGQFGWRLSNSLKGRTGFVQALKGWHESLEAEALQKEESASYAISAGFLVLNGAVVGLIVVALFSAFVAMIEGGVLW